MTADAIGQLPATKTAASANAQIRNWLYFTAFLVFCMVLVGGATRITNSGLSITEWQLLIGTLPPMNEADWASLFEKYKLIPQFKIQNPDMTIDQFKYIFWWEWSHRLLGRVIATVIALVLVYYGAMRRLSWGLAARIVVLEILVGAQGVLGWFMVKSGLSERTDVSQYRLAAHLALGCICFAAIVWVASGIGRRRVFPNGFHSVWALLLLLLVLVQITAGGFVAGLDAGHASATWPLMDGKWIPDGLDAIQPAWRNAFENALAVQFNHRMMAYAIFLLALLHAWFSFRIPAVVLAYFVLVQAGIGILTVVMNVRPALALVHQGTALVVLAVAVWNLSSQTLVRTAPDPDPQ